MKTLCEKLEMARKVGVPMVGIETADPWASIADIVGCKKLQSLNLGDDEPLKTSFVRWDCIRGFVGINEAGKIAVSDVQNEFPISNPVDALVSAERFGKGVVLFFVNFGRFVQEVPVMQALSNLRDVFKSDFRMVVMIGIDIALPAELAGDVVMFDDPLPDADKIRAIVANVQEMAGIPDLGLEQATEALLGLNAFQVEQLAAMGVTKKGLDVDSLWEAKRKQVEETPGLKVYRDKAKFCDIGGVENIKSFVGRILNGANDTAPNAIVFIDEIEKAMAGAGGDTSGVSSDQLGCLLSYMQDNACAGMIFVGPPGAAKSVVAKAAGGESGIPTIQLDLGATKGSLVGQSEQQLRAALKVISAVSNGKSLWIATCNSIADLPPELRRRFKLGTFFFDLPSAEERKQIWKIYAAKFGHKPMKDVNDDKWTGAEIEQCCEIAYRLGCSLVDASAYIVPVARSAADKIEALRRGGSGKFISATYPGVYEVDRKEEAKSGRSFAMSS